MSFIFFTVTVITGIAVFIVLVRQIWQPKKLTPAIELEWHLGILEKPLKILYVTLSIGIFLISLYATNWYRIIVFNPLIIDGELTRIYCGYKFTDDDCPGQFRVYEISYTVDGEEYTVSSSERGRRITRPSPLYHKHAKLGDHVQINADRENPSKRVKEKY